MEVKDVLENYTNLEKECESAKQPVSVELQVKILFKNNISYYTSIIYFNYIQFIITDKIYY